MHWRPDCAWRDCVHTNAPAGVLDRERAGDRIEAAFGQSSRERHAGVDERNLRSVLLRNARLQHEILPRRVGLSSLRAETPDEFCPVAFRGKHQSANLAGYHLPMCAPPSTCSTSPVTCGASVK